MSLSLGWWLAAAALTLLVLVLAIPRRLTPEERERRRRLAVHRAGRITDGLITETHVIEAPYGAVSHLVHFTYDVRGVGYSASQDISSVLAYLERDPGRVSGPSSVKYLPENPSNSIVICELWSGLR